MGGIVKGIKKVFHAVGSFVKKYWKVIVIAAAIYFTAGMAMGAMAGAGTVTTASTVGAVEAGGGYAATATAIAGTATEAGIGAAAAGTAAEVGAATLLPTVSVTAAAATGGGMAGMVAGGAAALGAASLAATSGSTEGSAEQMGPPTAEEQAAQGVQGTVDPYSGLDEFGNGPAGGGDAAINSATDSYLNPSFMSKVGGVAQKGVDAAKGFWGGMSTGEKLMFASTAFSALSGALKQPTRAEEGLWPGGAFFGMDEKGNTTDLASVYKAGVTGADQQPTAPPATKATAAAPPPGGMKAGGNANVGGTMAGSTMDTTGANDTQDNNLPTASAGAASGSSLLPAAGSGAANAQRANQQGQTQLADAQTRNQKFFDDLRDRLDANDRSNPGA